MLTKPSILLNMLNTNIENIYGNDKYCIYVTSNGNGFSIGNDFRNVKQDFLHGIPKYI